MFTEKESTHTPNIRLKYDVQGEENPELCSPLVAAHDSPENSLVSAHTCVRVHACPHSLSGPA